MVDIVGATRKAAGVELAASPRASLALYQSAQAWALAFGLVPDEHRAAVASYLCSSVNFRQRRLTTGYARCSTWLSKWQL